MFEDINPKEVQKQWEELQKKQRDDEEAAKPTLGRPRKTDELRHARSFSVTHDTYEVMRKFGNGNASAGIERAALLITKYKLWEKDGEL